MSMAGRHVLELVIGAAALSIAGCGAKAPPAESSAAPAASAVMGQAPAAAPAASAPDLTSEQACTLVSSAAVLEILGANANATPQQQPATPELTSSRCIWDAGNSDLTLTVMQAKQGVNAMILNSMPMEGEALSGVGDQAGVTVQGNYNVEVMARAGGRVMTLEASGLGIADRKDAVIAAAKAAAARLR
jgi:hypothetical protein